MLSQCDRLEAELRKGRVLSPMQIINELRIPKYTNRISELREKGLRIKVDESKGYGLYSLETSDSRPENLPGMGDAYEPPHTGKITMYQCEKGHLFKFYGEGGDQERCGLCNWRELGKKL